MALPMIFFLLLMAHPVGLWHSAHILFGMGTPALADVRPRAAPAGRVHSRARQPVSGR
jgi:hypothetical protein